MAAHQIDQFIAIDPRKYSWVCDLEAVKVQDRQHCAVARRVQELVRVPARREWPGLRFTIADDTGNDQIGIVEGGAISVRQRIAKLAAFVDRARCLGRDMARDTAWPGELSKQPVHAVPAALNRRKMLGVGAFEIGVRD